MMTIMMMEYMKMANMNIQTTQHTKVTLGQDWLRVFSLTYLDSAGFGDFLIIGIDGLPGLVLGGISLGSLVWSLLGISYTMLGLDPFNWVYLVGCLFVWKWTTWANGAPHSLNGWRRVILVIPNNASTISPRPA